jgi:hypothetical protein
MFRFRITDNGAYPIAEIYERPNAKKDIREQDLDILKYSDGFDSLMMLLWDTLQARLRKAQ